MSPEIDVDVLTIDNITTHGRFKEAMISKANEVFPEPELPATPIILVLAHGGLYRVSIATVLEHHRATKVEH